jgi:hypothetical protein
MTGRSAGYCAGYAMPGYANPGLGRGLGALFGFGGGGRGWRNMFYATGLPGWQRFGGAGLAPVAPENEAATLKAQADVLRRQLEAISKRIAEIEQT